MFLLLALLSSVLTHSVFACNEQVTTGLGEFNLPDYNVNCTWTFGSATGSPSVNISLYFHSVYFQRSSDCVYQKVQILDENGEEIWQNCRSMTSAVYYFTGNKITVNYIVLSNPRSNTVLRFMYRVVDRVTCGDIRVVRQDAGTISAPKENGLMLTNVNCLWMIINKQRYTTLVFSFTHMELEIHDGSCEDTVQVFDGLRDSEPNGTYCGSAPPDPFFVESVMTLKLTSDNDNPFSGFTAYYFSDSNWGQEYITSPVGALEGYTSKNVKRWVFIGDEGMTLKVIFTRFSLRPSDCARDGCIKFYPRYQTYGSTLDTSFSYDIGKIYEFDSNVVTIQLLSSYYFAFGNGFSLTYYMGKNDTCGGLFNSSSGTLTFPRHRGDYDNMMHCAWAMVGLPGETVTFQILTNHIEDDCTSDSLKVYDDKTSDSSTLLEACNSNLGTAVSTGHQLHLIFQSDALNTYNGFTAQWTIETEGCGGVFLTQSGTFTSDDKVRGEALHCEWHITVSNDQYIELSFTKFDLFRNADCDVDYVEIRNDDTANSLLLLRTCDFGTSRTFVSISHQLYIIYHSSASSRATGVAASYSTTSINCGSNIYGDRGSLNLPTGSNSCLWRIGRYSDSKVSLLFQNFTLQSSVNCNDEYVQVWDVNGTHLLKACGSDLPSLIVAGQIIVFFRSHVSSSTTNFKALYLKGVELCGSIVTREHGILVPPQYEDVSSLYEVECFWLIAGQPGQRVVLYFSHMKMSSGEIQTYDGERRSEYYYTDVTEMPPALITTSNTLFLEFFTNIYARDIYEGFIGHYEIFDGPLEKEILLADMGSISVARDRSYGVIHHEWHIVGAPGSTLTMYFTKFFLDTIHNCSVDYFEIRNGWNAGSPLIVRSCDFSIGTLYQYNIPEAYIIFHSEDISRGDGFTLFYHIDVEDCGGIIVLPEGNITFPNSGEKYEQLVHCSWVFVGWQKAGVSFVITENNVGSTRFDKDYLKFFDGASEQDPMLKELRYNNPTTGDLVQPSGKQMIMVFESDDYESNFGFVGRWSFRYDGCGKVFFTEPSGEFSSDNKMENEDLHCEWHVIGKFDSLIELSFTEYDLGTNCTEDYVEIRDGDGPESPLLYRMCANIREKKFSAVNQVFLVYHSSRNSEATGITASYKIINASERGKEGPSDNQAIDVNIVINVDDKLSGSHQDNHTIYG